MGLSSENADYVSMHHRIRRTLRRRLKHAAAEIERPVTDIVNEAIESWLGTSGSSALQQGTKELSGASTAEKVEWLRNHKDNGGIYAAAASIDKADLVAVLQYFRREADLRMSGDRLISMVVKEL